MDPQNKRDFPYEDEINLYDYWKVIVRRKRLIIGLFLISIISATVISLLMPKVYRGEAILRITAKEIITAKEMAGLIGKPSGDRLKVILPKTYHSVTDIKLTAMRDSIDKLELVIESKKHEDIPTAIAEFVEHINNLPIIKRFVEQQRERLTNQSEELSKNIESSKELVKTYQMLLKRGTLIPVGFNPIELNKMASDSMIEKLGIEHTIKYLKGVEIVYGPHILKNPVKPKVKMNIALAGIISLFLGIFLAFFMEYVKKMGFGKEG